MIQNKIPSREIWIDLAKFISIFLVVLFHTNPHLDGYLFDILQVLRMPAFFLIAGLLFNIDKWTRFTDFFVHRFKRLLIPYFWFYLVFYILWLLVGRDMVGESELAINPFVPAKEFILGKPSVILGPYWFITCLFCMQLLFYLFKKYIKSSVLIIIISILGYLALMALDIKDLPWYLDKALQYMPFYAYANIMRTHMQTILLHKRRIALLLSIITMAIVYVNHRLVSSAYLHHMLYIIAGFCVMPVYIDACKYLASKFGTRELPQLIRYIGDNNIITLALQNYIIGFIKIIGIATLGFNLLTTNHYTINVLIAFATISISMGISFLINRYAPFIIGKSVRRP
jgi:fucose 4-O-acetylase-like acetyltransferase